MVQNTQEETMTDPKAAVAAITTPETFNFAAAVLDRSYARITVPVYLNERSIQSLVEIYKEREELENKIAKIGTNVPVEYATKLNDLTELYDLTRDELKSQEYSVVITGISPEEQLQLEEQSYETYPREYEETVNPLTGGRVKTEITNDEWSTHFTALLRQAHLVSVTAPNGAVDSDFTDLDKVKVTFARLPIMARAKVDEAINASTIQVDFYRELVDEVF